MVGRGLNLRPISADFSGTLRLVQRACDRTPRGAYCYLCNSLVANDSSGRVHPFTQCKAPGHISHLSNFRLSCTDLPFVWLGLETHLQVRSEISQTPSGLVAKPDRSVSCCPEPSDLAFHDTKTPPSSSALFTSLTSFLLRKREMWDSAWWWLFVAKSMSSTCTIIPMRRPRKVTQAEEGRVQFECFP